MVKANAFVFTLDAAYVPREAVPADIIAAAEAKGEDWKTSLPEAQFEIPDGYKLVPMVDIETGEIRKAKDGSELKVLAY